MLLRQPRVESESQAVERLWRRGGVESCAEEVSGASLSNKQEKHQMTTTKHLSRIVIFAATALLSLALMTPAKAQTDSLRINPNGDIGMGTLSPSASLHVERNDGTAKLFVEETSGTTAVECAGLQSGQSVATAGTPAADQELVTVEPTASVDEDGLLLAEGHLNHRLYGEMLNRLAAPPVPGGCAASVGAAAAESCREARSERCRQSGR